MPRVLKINHIGLATDDPVGSLRFLVQGLGLDVGGAENVTSDSVRVSFLPVGETKFELLEPVGVDGPVQRFLTNRGPGIHHICLEVDDLMGMLDHLKTQGVRLLDLEPRPGAHGTLVAFIHPKAAGGVLIELVQPGE